MRLTPVVPSAAGTSDRYENSFFHLTSRRRLMPQVCGPAPLYRSVLKGIATSTVHPCSKRCVFTYQIPFHAEFCWSSVMVMSRSAPSGLVWNKYPLRRSWSVSMTNVRFSLPRMLPLSRRSSLATSRAGCESHSRAAT